MNLAITFKTVSVLASTLAKRCTQDSFLPMALAGTGDKYLRTCCITATLYPRRFITGAASAAVIKVLLLLFCGIGFLYFYPVKTPKQTQQDGFFFFFLSLILSRQEKAAMRTHLASIVICLQITTGKILGKFTTQ